MVQSLALACLLVPALLPAAAPLTAQDRTGSGAVLEQGREPIPQYRVRFGVMEPPSPARAVFDVHVDRRGFLWMATLEGLHRYDGYEIVAFSRQEDHAPVPLDDAVRVLAEGPGGELWIGSFSTGVSCYDPTSGALTHFRHDPNDPSTLADDQILSLLPNEDGTVWVGTAEGGLELLDPRVGRVVQHRHVADGTGSFSTSAVSALARDAAGRVWVGTGGGGLARLEEDGRLVPRVLRAGGQEGVVVTALAPAATGGLWVGTATDGLARHDPEAGATEWFRHDPSDSTTLSDDHVSTLLVDETGAVWIGTEGAGLNRLDPATRRVERYGRGTGSLPDDLVLDLAIDREGTLWVATSGGGVLHGKRLQAQFRPVPGGDPSRGTGEVRAMDVAADGTVWIGLFGNGLLRWDPGTGSSRAFPPDPEGRTGPSDGTVNDLVVTPDGVVWVGSLSGLDRLDAASGTFRRVPLPGTEPEVAVSGLAVSPSGTVWVGSRRGLHRLDPSTGAARSYELPRTRRSAVTVQSVYAPDDDDVWVGTGSDGVLRVDAETGHVTRFDYPADSLSTAWRSIQHLTGARDGSLWIGARDGLFSLDPVSGVVTRRGEAAGLRGVWVGGIGEADDGSLWLNTTIGLYRYDPEADRSVRFDESDGLPSTAMLAARAWLPDGDLLVATYGGLVRISPSSLRPNPVPPPVHVIETRVMDQPVAAEPSPDGTAVRLAPGQRMVSFHFAGLSFLDPAHNRYRYRLEGFEDAWHEVGADRRVATYTNLEPGRYVFRVTASNNRGVWSDGATTVAVHVRPHWWASAPARVLGLVALAVLLVALHRTRVRSIEARGRKLEREMDDRRRSQDALDQLSHLERVATLGELTASIAHELNQPLSAVVANAEAGRRFLAREAMTVAEVDEILQDISAEGQRAGRVLQRLRALLRRSPFVRVPVDVNRVVLEVADLLAADAARRRTSIELDLEQGVPEVLGDPVQMQQVVLNLILNGLDAVEASGRHGARVGVRTAAHNGSVDVDVWDTGVGLHGLEEHVFKPFFTTKADGLGMGVSLSRSIVEAHGGVMTARDNEGPGSTFSFSLPIPEEES